MPLNFFLIPNPREKLSRGLATRTIGVLTEEHLSRVVQPRLLREVCHGLEFARKVFHLETRCYLNSLLNL